MGSLDNKRDSSTSVPVFDPKYCMDHTMHLIIKPKIGIFTNTLYTVLDTSGNELLKVVKGDTIFSMSKDRLLLDANGSPVAILTHKTLSWNDVWRVYKGKDNSGEGGAICRVKRMDRLLLDVFMGSTDETDEIMNKKRNGDFEIVGFPPSIYKGDTIVADVNNSFSWGGDAKNGFKVRIEAVMDYAFIVCLIIIEREMAMSRKTTIAVTEAVVGGGIDLSFNVIMALAAAIGGGVVGS